jgi:hypothetical protein
MTVRGTARGRTIELDEALPFPSGQKLNIDIQPLETGALLGSPARLLEAVRQPPHISPEEAAELESAIQSGRLSTGDRGVFDDFTDSE